jgi:hypothetical protein
MDHAVLENALCAGKISSVEVLLQTPIDGLDEVLTMLMRHRSAGEVCKALMERIGAAPLDEFNALKLDLYAGRSAHRVNGRNAAS